MLRYGTHLSVMSVVLRHFSTSEFLHLLSHLPGMPFPKILIHLVCLCHQGLSSYATFSKKPSHCGLLLGVYFYHITLLWFLSFTHHCQRFVCWFLVCSPQRCHLQLGQLGLSHPRLYSQHPAPGMILYLMLTLVPSRRASGSLLPHAR